MVRPAGARTDRGRKYDLQVTYGALTATASQAVNYAARANADSMLTIDRSGSMAENSKLASAQAAALLYVDSWRTGDKLGVVSFNDTVSLDLGLTDWTDTPGGGSRQTAFNAINALVAGGNTAIGDAVRKSWNEVKANGVAADDWAVVLLSDGLSNSGESFQAVIAALKAETAKKPVIHAIAVGPDADQTLMQQAANDTGGTYQFVSTPAPASLTAFGAAAAATTTATGSLQLDLDQRYRVIASKIAGQQQVFGLVGPLADGDPSQDLVTIPIENGASELVLSLSWDGGTITPTLRDPNQNVVAAFHGDGRHSVWRCAESRRRAVDAPTRAYHHHPRDQFRGRASDRSAAAVSRPRCPAQQGGDGHLPPYAPRRPHRGRRCPSS